MNSFKYVFKTLRSKSSVTRPPYIASPIRYLKVDHGSSSSFVEIALLRYKLIKLSEIRKSLSLKSQLTFHPILPNFLRSYMTAWKKETTQIRDLYSGLGHSFSISSVTLVYADLMLAPKPSGGSVTTLIDLCRIPRGNQSVGLVVSQSLNCLSGLVRDSIIASSFLSQEVSKWQF